MRAKREFDIIVWGATGFTGKLVAEYLARQQGSSGALRWAVAGRNAQKLSRVCAEIAREVPGFKPEQLPQLLADSADLDSLRALAIRSRVIITTVGPYALYGSALVQACAESGTDYCDLSGEPHWIQRMIGAWEQRARETGARLVHCCGFDSIPFDLGVWFLQQNMLERHGEYARTLKGCVRHMKGGASGGTIASMLNFVAEAAKDPALRRFAANPNALLPQNGKTLARAVTRQPIEFDADLKVWTAPFVMAAINTKIVRRSNALLGFPWGEDFRYDESLITGTGAAGHARAIAVHVGMSAFIGAAALAPGRALLRKLLPEPGAGPSPEQQRAGYYEIVFVARHARDPSSALMATVRGDCDPGYGSTSKMLAESALCLALDNVSTTGGSWTPASAMGGALLKRLQDHAGLSFAIQPLSA